MQDTIPQILEKIDTLNHELKGQYDQLTKKYGFSFEKRKIVFLDEIRKRNKAAKYPTWKYIILSSIRNILSIPFIYGMIIPAVILDLALTLYQWTAFPLYHIPRVRREDYFVYDRRFLDYLNIIQKINCLYCSYVNGLFAYAVEIGARTERYWCPIKAASKPHFTNNWYKDYADYGSAYEWSEKTAIEDTGFIDVYGEKCFIRK